MADIQDTSLHYFIYTFIVQASSDFQIIWKITTNLKLC